MPKKKVTTQVVHFTVHGDWATGFVRERWSEGAYRWCLDFLQSCGVPDFKTCYRIINGAAKLADVPNEPNVLTLEPDDWKPRLDHCHLLQYPDPTRPGEMAAAEEKLLQQKAKEQFGKFLWEIEQERERNSDKATRRSNSYSDAPIVNKFLQGQQINHVLAVSGSKPAPSDPYENGIVLRDGTFYRCGVMGHTVLAMSLGYEGDMIEHAPSEAALRDGCVFVSASPVSRRIRVGKGGASKKQEKFLKRWHALTAYLQNAPFYRDEFTDLYPDEE